MTEPVKFWKITVLKIPQYFGGYSVRDRPRHSHSLGTVFKNLLWNGKVGDSVWDLFPSERGARGQFAQLCKISGIEVELIECELIDGSTIDIHPKPKDWKPS